MQTGGKHIFIRILFKLLSQFKYAFTELNDKVFFFLFLEGDALTLIT